MADAHGVGLTEREDLQTRPSEYTFFLSSKVDCDVD